MKRTISVILFLSMILSISSYAAEETVSEINYITADISEYTNNEVFIMYTDKSYEVVTFDDKNALSEGLDILSKQENVLLYQPNYSYSTNTINSDDPLASQQWALENDGTFYMEEKKNEFPVFDKPFDEAKKPGQWQMPDDFSRSDGIFRNLKYSGISNSVSAVEDIDININDAWDIYHDSGKDVIVAMVDTGIDYTHEELSGKIWTNIDEIPGNGIDDDGNGYIDDVYGWNFYHNTPYVYVGSEDDHGTHGAGTMVAKTNNGTGISGIVQSDHVKVMSVKALGGKDGSGSTASVIQAIQYAEQNGASICNLSLGTSNNDQALYQTIANSNMLFVIAAGNDGTDNDVHPCYPASYDLDNIISVANLNYDGKLNYSSNYGANSVDIAAPGSYILSTTTNNSYSYMTGTSMAAPMVSGAAALIYSHYENITLADVKELLLSTAKKLTSLENLTATGGMLDVGSALSFDIKNLSGEQWEIKTPTEYTGNVPIIKTYLMQKGRMQYLAVQVYDEDNDLAYVSYAEGEQTADYFGNYNAETKLKLDQNGIAILEAKQGTYTFYAVDAKGNETVFTIVLTEQWK